MLALAWAGFVLAVYCPDVGRGFVKDDFTWIRSARAAVSHPSTFLLPTEPGFYRPIVAASFALDYEINQWRPRGYGWTNLGLYLACTVAVAVLGSALGLSAWAAALAAFVWAVNPHGISMAVVWLSGRTALCLTLFSLAAAIACVRRRYGWMAAAIAFALLSKEEAVALPFVLLAWTAMRDRRTSRAALAAALLPLAAYVVVRAQTPAFTPHSAPAFYGFTARPALVARNAAEYLDRSATLALVVTLVAALIGRRLPRRDADVDRIASLSLAWWTGMFALTMWLPVRSSLYAVCPSVAPALLCGALVQQLLSHSTPGRAWALEAVVAGAVLAAAPIYRIRHAPWAEGARVSQRTISAIGARSPQLPRSGTIVLRDADDPVSNFHNAFGDLATEALQTVFDRPWRGYIVDGGSQPPSGAIAECRLAGGQVIVTAPADTPR